MRTTLIAALLCAASLVLPCAHAQQTVALRKLFLEYKARAEKGDAEAQKDLSGLYFNGEGVEQNLAEALKWLRKAAEQNNAAAQYNLGVCYDKGQGVVKDLETAVRWFRKAADQNHASAQLNLGLCY